MDLVDTMRVMAGAVICAVVGLESRSEDDHRQMFHRGEQIVSMVTLRTRTLPRRRPAVPARSWNRSARSRHAPTWLATRAP
ncbi:hypothetical protein ACFQZ4_51555 [Catellatospora coxensis]